jgi:hypothetical protein
VAMGMLTPTMSPSGDVVVMVPGTMDIRKKQPASRQLLTGTKIKILRVC